VPHRPGEFPSDVPRAVWGFGRLYPARRWPDRSPPATTNSLPM